MTPDGGTVLVVDDSLLNRKLLQAALEAQGHQAIPVANGRAALDALAEPRTPPFDLVLLDLEMPELDGYQTLELMKADESMRHLPVIVISAIDEIDSIARVIEMGATDYLPKPFEAAVLRARVNASLADKRLRDLEREYLEQVATVIGAAAAVEADAFDADSLAGVAARDDALGQLARVFQRMATEIRAREERLRREVRELRIEIDEARQAARVAEITDSDYFRDLRSRAHDLRGSVRRPPAARTD